MKQEAVAVLYFNTCLLKDQGQIHTAVKYLTCSIHSLDSGGEGKDAKIITPTYRYVNPTRKYAIERSLT